MRLSHEPAGRAIRALLVQDRHSGLPPLINIGVGEDVTTQDLPEFVRRAGGFKGRLCSTWPDRMGCRERWWISRT